VLEEEAGAIPMTTDPGPIAATPRVTPIGLAGGAARPSSGYAFLRIQRQARRLAGRIAAGEEPGPGELRRALGPPKYRFFDSVFLRTLADRPELAPRIFGPMFARAEPAALVRFPGERSTTADDLRIVAALPKAPFLAAAARSMADRLPGKPWRESIADLPARRLPGGRRVVTIGPARADRSPDGPDVVGRPGLRGIR